jgi:hypothetical protein
MGDDRRDPPEQRSVPPEPAQPALRLRRKRGWRIPQRPA